MVVGTAAVSTSQAPGVQTSRPMAPAPAWADPTVKPAGRGSGRRAEGAPTVPSRARDGAVKGAKANGAGGGGGGSPRVDGTWAQSVGANAVEVESTHRGRGGSGGSARPAARGRRGAFSIQVARCPPIKPRRAVDPIAAC